MQFFACRAQFQHLARDHDAALRRHRGQRVHHRVQGRWIGIVTIVDDRDVAQLDDRPPFVRGSESRQRASGFGEAQPSFHSDRDRGQRVIDVVRAHQGQGRTFAAAAGHDIEHRACGAA